MLSIVIPIYNEEEIFHILHNAVSEAAQASGEDYEIVYVNDGSRDRSLQIMLDTQKRDPHVVAVDLARNFGHMGAIYAGLTTAKGDAVILMDGDMQDPPACIPEMVQKWREGAQVVTTVRRSRQESRVVLRYAFQLWHWLFDKVSDFKMPRDAGIFSLMDRQALDTLNALPERNRYFPGLRAWVGYNNAIVYYDRADRVGGEGKLSFMSRIKYATDAIYSFSAKPLRVSMLAGVLSILTAFGLGIAAIVSAAAGDAAAGDGTWATYLGLMAAIAFVGGLQMFCLGIFAEYIARIYDEIRRRPLSIINKVYRADRATGLQYDEQPAEAEQLKAA
jgi:glycosyltransferase involved in cell wall biosynthesis